MQPATENKDTPRKMTGMIVLLNTTTRTTTTRRDGQAGLMQEWVDGWIDRYRVEDKANMKIRDRNRNGMTIVTMRTATIKIAIVPMTTTKMKMLLNADRAV